MCWLPGIAEATGRGLILRKRNLQNAGSAFGIAVGIYGKVAMKCYPMPFMVS